ncbi:hypothetical protein [Pedobacter sp. Hv1]|uniref:hypothetical protein n=1 Tax=Pedobacter sp. Hv1 TaxID=1740090 RepID=UPI0006D8CEBB|nr:hypothetical protein [Pedobacter sp. Hv1]KQC02058.1 hypothetical protein AQF98_00350 [Pedobacter sp. Hv1]
MFTKKDLQKIRKALPKNGYKLISDRLGMSAEAIRMTLLYPERYNKKVIDAAEEVIIEYKNDVALQKARVMEVVK